MSKNIWNREEHILAFNLYCKIPFTKINATYAPVKELAKIIGRTNGAVAMKLANFARLDPALKARNVSGLTQGAKGEEEIWNEFNSNWEELAYESERILSNYSGIPIEKTISLPEYDHTKEGKDRETIVKARVNQEFFRNAVLASYNNKCSITGIDLPELLVASHIIPWSKEIKHRTNPANGLCLNRLHDRAFDAGLITITPDFIIHLSEKLFRSIKKTKSDWFFLPYDGKKLILPQKFYPEKEFLEYHNSKVFKK